MPSKEIGYAKKWRDANKDKIASYGRVYRRKHKNRLAKQKKEYLRRNYKEARERWHRYSSKPERKERARDLFYQRLYGISLERVKQMLLDQGNKCGICRQKIDLVMEAHKPNSCHVDHNHTTRQVRGLLCNKCNRGLGLLRDSTTLLESAIVWLRRGN